ncbi:MAG: peptidoglycan DD-metalloendopeptidase family protein [Gammaproteobacteria bacterium]
MALGVLVISGCGHYGNFPAGDRGAAVAPAYHVVSRGETLYSIAWQYGLDYRIVAKWNGIGPPYPIYPGQRIYFEPASARLAREASAAGCADTSASHRAHDRATRAPARHPSISDSAGNASASSSSSRPRHTRSRQTSGDQRLGWQWPTQGRLISTFSARDAGKRGVDIEGKLGQPIYAAAPGTVVYSGSGLLGYGKLIIIKHNDTYLSAYAHNSDLLVKEDEEVKTGEHIADMGDSGADRVMLHFEIRRDGKPVDPLDYLPKRH